MPPSKQGILKTKLHTLNTHPLAECCHSGHPFQHPKKTCARAPHGCYFKQPNKGNTHGPVRLLLQQSKPLLSWKGGKMLGERLFSGCRPPPSIHHPGAAHTASKQPLRSNNVPSKRPLLTTTCLMFGSPQSSLSISRSHNE